MLPFARPFAHFEWTYNFPSNGPKNRYKHTFFPVAYAESLDAVIISSLPVDIR